MDSLNLEITVLVKVTLTPLDKVTQNIDETLSYLHYIYLGDISTLYDTGLIQRACSFDMRKLNMARVNRTAVMSKTLLPT